MKTLSFIHTRDSSTNPWVSIFVYCNFPYFSHKFCFRFEPKKFALLMNNGLSYIVLCPSFVQSEESETLHNLHLHYSILFWLLFPPSGNSWSRLLEWSSFVQQKTGILSTFISFIGFQCAKKVCKKNFLSWRTCPLRPRQINKTGYFFLKYVYLFCYVCMFFKKCIFYGRHTQFTLVVD